MARWAMIAWEATEAMDRWHEIKDIFAHAVELEPQQRVDWLEVRCGRDSHLRHEIQRLLDAHEAAGEFLDGGSDFDSGDDEDVPHGEAPGDVIGRYRLIEQIGEGGFGVVYKAAQFEPVKRDVALKIIKLGMDTVRVVARFEAERQALAVMDHPNIARVLDAGATESGRPYFVMELVRGVPITDYCDAQRLSIHQRVDLFMQVCDAVQHAHLKGVIHRDLKPSNVLVTEIDGKAQPKVIDFGIAKALEAKLTEQTFVTQFRQLVGTPQFMSPEQAQWSGVDVDTRSDVYSLGVLLYVLLTGYSPYGSATASSSVEAVREMILTQEPRRPSATVGGHGASRGNSSDRPTGSPQKDIYHDRRTDANGLRLQLKGDVDWIVLKAMEKDRSRRYQSAAELQLDLQRLLKDEPVSAGPPGTRYKLRKFVKRNRTPVAAGFAIVVLLLLSTIGLSVLSAWALRERDRANLEAMRAVHAAEQEAEARRVAEANERRAEIEATRAQAAEEDAAERLAELEAVAEFQAAQIGRIVPDVIAARLRESLYTEAAAAATRVQLDPEVAEARTEQLQDLLSALNLTNVGRDLIKQAFLEQTRTAVDLQFADQPLVRARLLHQIALALHNLHLFDAAMDTLDEAIRLRRDLLGGEHPDTLESLHVRASLWKGLREWDLALAQIQEVIETRKRVLGHDHEATMASLASMAITLRLMSRFDESESLYLDSLERAQRALDENHNAIRSLLVGYGQLLQELGRSDEAEPLLRRAVKIGETNPEIRPAHAINDVRSLAVLLHTSGRLEEAKALYERVLEGNRAHLGDEHPLTIGSMIILASVIETQGDLETSEAMLRDIVPLASKALGDEHTHTLHALHRHSMLLRRLGDDDAAEQQLRRVLDARMRVLGHNHVDTISTAYFLGALLESQQRLDEAEVLLRQALEGRQRLYGKSHPQTLITMTGVADLLRSLERYSEADEMGAETVAIARTALPEGHWHLGIHLVQHAQTLMAMEQFSLAEAQLLEAHELLERALGATHHYALGTVQLLVDLYLAWHEASPGLGLDEKASQWRSILTLHNSEQDA